VAAERRRGRRDNGLDATDFVAAGDLDPRVGEHLLDVLGAQGIAAYLQPSADINPVTRHTTMPDRPTDRLFVDRAHLRTARDYLDRIAAEAQADAGAAPGGAAGPVGRSDAGAAGAPPTDPTLAGIDATFARIVAGYDRPADPTTTAPWPAVEDATTRPEAGAGPAEPPAPPRPGELPRRRAPVDARHVTEPSLLDALDTFGADLPDESQDERYTPPPPPPLPRISKQAVLGTLAVVVGFVMFLFPDLFPLERGTSLLLGFAAIAGGATALILRLRPGNDPDDYDPDDGARV
jgi:hypothetical protein